MRAQHAPGVLIYDGDCGFCSTAASWIGLRSDTTITPYQWCSAADLAVYHLTVEEAARKVQYICYGRRLSGAAAIAAVLRACRQPAWRVLGHILAFPGISILARIGYTLIARYRHRLPGGTPTCRIPR